MRSLKDKCIMYIGCEFIQIR